MIIRVSAEVNIEDIRLTTTYACRGMLATQMKTMRPAQKLESAAKDRVAFQLRLFSLTSRFILLGNDSSHYLAARGSPFATLFTKHAGCERVCTSFRAEDMAENRNFLLVDFKSTG